MLWAQREVCWGGGRGDRWGHCEERSEGLFPWDIPLLCPGDAGRAPLGRWMWGVGPTMSRAIPGVPVSQLPGTGGGGDPSDTALSHTGGSG